MSDQMSRQMYNHLVDVEEFDLRDDYSRKFMYGNTCLGIETSNPFTAIYEITNALRLIYEGKSETDVTQDLMDEAGELLDSEYWRKARSDNLGLDFIVYFPGITVEEPSALRYRTAERKISDERAV